MTWIIDKVVIYLQKLNNAWWNVLPHMLLVHIKYQGISLKFGKTAFFELL